MRRATLGLVALLSACGDGGAPPGPRPAPEPPAPEARPAPPSAPPQVEPSPRPLGRVTRVEGDSRIERGTRVTDDRPLVTAAGSVTLDLRDGARVELGPGTIASLSDEAPALVLLAAGRARGRLAPAGGSARPALRVATPAATIEIGGSGDVAVLSLPDLTAWVVVLHGRCEILTGAAGDDRGPTAVSVVAGRSARIGREGIELGPGVAREEEIAVREVELLRAAPAPTLEAAAARRAELAAAVDEAAGWVAEERVHGEALAGQQRAATPERARELQSELVRHAQARLRLRATLLGRWERERAATLAGGAPLPAERAARVRGLLGVD